MLLEFLLYSLSLVNIRCVDRYIVNLIGMSGVLACRLEIAA